MSGAKVSDEDLARHARFLARLGVNMVRVGGATSGLMPQKEGSAITDVNEQFLDDVWRTVAAMKKEGIYVRVSPFWDHGSVKYINPDWGIEGYSSGDTVNGLLFFEPTLQRGYKAWMKHLLTDVKYLHGHPAEGRSSPGHRADRQRGHDLLLVDGQDQGRAAARVGAAVRGVRPGEVRFR